MPFVSIIVPAYNVEDYIRECVDSILAQSFTDFELLLVDDGSTDSTGQLCDGYATVNARVRVLGGLVSARKAGLAAGITRLTWTGTIGSRPICCKTYAWRRNGKPRIS